LEPPGARTGHERERLNRASFGLDGARDFKKSP
jgi:hypothetical protein